MLGKLVAKRGELPVHLVRADATRLPFAPASFDALVAVHVFHLIPGWREVLAGAARLLRRGGLLLHGSDDNSRDFSSNRWRERFSGQAEKENVGVPRAQLERFPEDEGWRPAGVHRIAFSRRIRPREMVALLAGRCWSRTWRLSDEELAVAVEDLRETLLAEVGDLEREVEIETGFWIRAYRPPER
jgi:SAM-dependent methyltransferase